MAKGLGTGGHFITGSSNLTGAGVERQAEFNVEIRDYGWDTAQAHFDALWAEAIPITEHAGRRAEVLDFMRARSHWAAAIGRLLIK